MKSKIVAIAILVGSFSVANACTDIVLKAKNGDVVVGRTLEFGLLINSSIHTSPAGRFFQSPAPHGAKGIHWTSRYGYQYIDLFHINHPVSGMNSKGLSYDILYLPGYTKFQTVPKGQDKNALQYFYLGDYLLGNFSTVDQVKKALRKRYVYSVRFSGSGWKNAVLAYHAIITDAKGKSITLEWNKGKLHIYDNKQNMLTNSPTFPWQVNNLKNYLSLSPYQPKANTVDGIDYVSAGQGAGAMGLPGDFSPPSRFVRVAFLKHYAFQPKDADDAVNLAQHILGTVDIPAGDVRPVKGDALDKQHLSDITQWFVFKDLTHHKLYYKSYWNTTVRKIDFNKINLSKGGPLLSMPMKSAQTYVDVTKRFRSSKG